MNAGSSQLQSHSVFRRRSLRFGIIAIVLAMFILAWIWIPGLEAGGWFAGYLLGFFAVLLHFLTSILMKNVPPAKIVYVYFAGMAARFILIIALFILFLISEKFDQLSFTVSFLISYLFHSMIDLISVHQSLANRSHNTKHH